MTTIGTAIRAARRKAGLEIKVLEAKAGLSKTYLGHIESGRRGVQIGTLQKIADALNEPGLMALFTKNRVFKRGTKADLVKRVEALEKRVAKLEEENQCLPKPGKAITRD